MRFYKRFLFAIALFLFCFSFTLVAYGFVVRAIQIQGLQRISKGTVIGYLSMCENQEYTSQWGQTIIETLYKTGYFDNIQLSRRGEALIITVKERPTINLIRLSGNKAISSEKLRHILNNSSVAENQPFDCAKLKQIEQGLEQQYGIMGYCAARISTSVVGEPRNRVSLYININEGNVAKVRLIQFFGNHAFNVYTLRNQFKLMTTGLFARISHADRYSQIKLEEDLRSLIIFYLNHGYLHFQVLSYEVQWSRDRRYVCLNIYINEGPIYRISGYGIGGEAHSFKDQLYKLIVLKSGDVFSRQSIIDTSKKIRDFLADQGYAFVKVTIIPRIDDKKYLIYTNFNIALGKRTYVRQINFLGNQSTDQEVLRREMCQYEGSIYSLSRIEESKRRLELLGYLSDITYTSQPVPDASNQIDLYYHVKEVSSGQASIQGGYSDVYGFLYGASISEPNFMGTGNYISIGFQSNQYRKNYSISYNNPYYATFGLQRGFSIYYSRIEPDIKFNLSSYLEDGYGADVIYGYPVSECNSIMFGFGLGRIIISHVDIVNAAPSALAFLGTTNGVQNTDANYNQVKLTTGWVYNGLDRAIFPTEGLYMGLDLETSVPIFKSSLDYYLATYTTKYYQLLSHGFILNLLAVLGYGDGFDRNRLPFFKNFFSGGIGSVPAFAPNSLGPKNRYPIDSNFGAIGGNLETTFGVHLILPTFISQQVRTAIVFDAGNIFQVPRFPGDIAIPARGGASDPKSNTQPQIIQDEKLSLKHLRPSFGLSVEWYTSFAPIDFTLAVPLNKRVGDHFQVFQFSFGASL